MNSNNMIFRARPYLCAAFLVHAAQAYVLFKGLHYYTEAAKTAIYTGFSVLAQIDQIGAAVIAFCAILLLIAMFCTKRSPIAADRAAFAAYLLLLIETVSCAIIRRRLTGLTPLTYSVILQTLLYICLMVVRLIVKIRPKTDNDKEQETVSGEPVLREQENPSENIECSESEIINTKE